MQKTSSDKKKGINLADLSVEGFMVPNWIQPTKSAVRLFGISDMPLEYVESLNLFLTVEPSGIIRQGISVELYREWSRLFITLYKYTYIT